jgi:hypothetical protein
MDPDTQLGPLTTQKKIKWDWKPSWKN